MYDHYVPALIDSILSRSEVLTPVHAVPAGGLAGHAAGHVRVPDGDLRAHGPAGLERDAVRGAVRGRRPRAGSRYQQTRARAVPRVARAPPALARGARHHQRGLGDDDRGDPARRRRHRRRRARRAASRRRRAVVPAVPELPRRGRGPRGARRRGAQGFRRARDRPVRPDRAGHPAAARRLRRRHRGGGGPAARQPARLRRPELRLLRRPGGIHPPDAGPDRGRDDRRRRPPRLRAHAADARAAHPAREGDAQHHAPRRRSTRSPASSTSSGSAAGGSSSSASCCSSARPTRARRWPRSRASSCCTSSRSCASSPSRSTPTSTP